MNKLTKIFIIIGMFLLNINNFLYTKQGFFEYKGGQKSKIILDVIKNNYNDNQKNIDNKTISIDNSDYIGTLLIPKLDLELPITANYSTKSLKTAPGRYYGSVYTNDLVICGHSYKIHFKYLNTLSKGDTIIFIDILGNKYFYEVIKKEILKPEEISKMINSEYDLTLYTCTNDGLNRITIRCNQIKNK